MMNLATLVEIQNGTINLQKLLIENADLRRQLDDPDYQYARGRIHRAAIECRNAEIDGLRRQLVEAERQRDEAKAACAAMRKELSFADRVVFDIYSNAQKLPWCDIEEMAKYVIQRTKPILDSADPGRDFLARLEAAERQCKAANGLENAIRIISAAVDGTITPQRLQNIGNIADNALAAYHERSEKED